MEGIHLAKDSCPLVVRLDLTSRHVTYCDISAKTPTKNMTRLFFFFFIFKIKCLLSKQGNQ